MIPFPQGAHRLADEKSLPRSIMAALPRTYAIIFYSTDVRFGWAMLAMSLLVPWVGLAGLGGVVVAACLAWLLKVDRGWIRSGFALFNPLLACSAMVLAGLVGGWALGVIVVLWAAAAVFSLLLTIAMQGWIGSRVGLSVQSLPAVMVVCLLHFTGIGAGGQGEAVAVAVAGLQADWVLMPDLLRGFFRAFAAMVFQASDVTGMLVYVAFVLSSPLGALMATVGYVAGAGTLWLLGLPVGATGTAWCGYCFLLAGVALGAGYQVPNRSSLVLAIAGGAMTAVAAVGLSVGLGWFGLSPGALPYNLVVLGTVAALRLLPRPAGLLVSPWTTLQPEVSARRVQINVLRFPDYYKPAVFLPCAGERVVTQGFDGALTHRGWWRHALDFEAPGAVGTWNAVGGALRDYAIFETPVYSPVPGTVVAMDNQVPDNPLGHNNPEANWGNYVMLRADAGYHVMLAHLLCGSVAVVVGQRVREGAYLGNCGNSGRSPVPHLHLHVQAGPLPGAATMPFVMKHYIERTRSDGQETYRLSGVPQQSCVLRPALPSAALHACFSGWLPGVYVFRNGDDEEEIRLEFDEGGRFRLESTRQRECLTLYLAEGVLYAEPFEGGRGGVLALLAIVLARVPCIAESAVTWHEVVAAAPYLHGLRRLFHDLCDPFLTVAVLHYKYGVVSNGDGFQLTAELAHTDETLSDAVPKRLQAQIQGRSAIVEIIGETCGGRQIHVAMKPTSEG
jgi:murein DD-endopeptidase MepM/ murein hydrolase activator NlpD/urea transporter